MSDKTPDQKAVDNHGNDNAPKPENSENQNQQGPAASTPEDAKKAQDDAKSNDRGASNPQDSEPAKGSKSDSKKSDDGDDQQDSKSSSKKRSEAMYHTPDGDSFKAEIVDENKKDGTATLRVDLGDGNARDLENVPECQDEANIAGTFRRV